MAVDMFIKIGDLKGESGDAKHAGEIDVLAWSWGISNSGDTHVGGGGGAGKVNVQDFSFTKWMDKSTPNLIQYGCSGKHFPSAELVVRKAGDKPLEYWRMTFTDVLITSVSTGGSGGELSGLPCHTFPTDDGGQDMKCPTEIAITDRREAELAKNGFMPLVHRKNSDAAYFIGAQSLQKPQEYDDADATANANLAARLPYMFACCRFAHYLKCIVRDKVGGFASKTSMQDWLKRWVLQYVDGDPDNSSEDTKARKPLAAAEVVVEEIEGNPGYYSSKFFLRPHYQLEGLTVSLRLVSKLPSQKK